MLESTKEKYRKNAQGFANKHLRGKPYSDKFCIDTLNKVAPNYTAKSYANLKAALSFYLKERDKNKLADEIQGLKNHAVENGLTKKPRLKKKTINAKEMKIISDAVTKKKDAPVQSAYILARILGARPSEMQHITQTSENSFLITGSKKSENGDRGLDRHVLIDKDFSRYIINAISVIKKDDISRIQDRFNYLMKRAFKYRKIKTTLYTLRHQFCSELKSSKLNEKEIAYLMGHQSTRTKEHYGYANAGSGSINIRAATTFSEIDSVVRDTQKKRHVERARRISNLKPSSQKSSA